MALQNQTFANSGSPYYGNPADWSKFSTLTSTIMFNDTNAKLKVIPAIPDSATTITFNGNQLAYAGDVPNIANWAQYPANHDVDIPAPYALQAQTGYISSLSTFVQTTDFLDARSTIKAINRVIAPLVTNSTMTILADWQTFPLQSPALNITSKNGLGGNITLKADSGSAYFGGGLITLQSEGGLGPLGLNGAIDIIAKSGDSAILGVTRGGRIDITATSGINDVTLTSAIKLSGAGINIQSGITSPITSVAGYTFIGGNLGVNSCAGIPAIIPSVPGENYIYGTNGIVLDSDVYTSDVYPKWDGVSNPDDLILHGRTVNIGFGAYNAMVELENVSQIAFETSGFRTGGAITGLSSINGVVYPPSGGGTSAGPAGAIQYADGAGGFLGNDGLNYNGTSRIENASGFNFIDINETANANSIAIQSFSAQVNVTAGDILGLTALNRVYITSASAMAIDIGSSLGTAGQVLTSDGTFTEWQDPPGGSAAGVSGAIQFSDGAGGFQGVDGFLFNGTSRITNDLGTNFIDIDDVANVNSIAIQTPNQVNITAGPVIALNSNEALYLTAGTFFKIEIANSTGTAGQILTSDGTYATWLDPPLSGSGFVDAFQIYVAPNGNDTTGNGSQQNPYLTIGRAITKRATILSTIEVSIILSSGTYTETFTLLRNTFLIGLPTGEQQQPVNVVGSIAMNTITNQVGISGLQVTGLSTGTLDTVRCLGSGGTYSIYNCNITGTVGNAINFFEGTAFMTECRVTGATSTYPAIDADSGSSVTIRDCTISNPTGNIQSVILSTGTISIHNSIIQSLNTTSTVLAPVIQFSSSTTPESIDITYCQVKYANTLTDTGGNKCCIKFTNSNAVVISMIYCLLSCEGAITGVGGQIQCIQRTGAGTVTLSYGNLLAGATANHIAPTIIHTALVTVV